MNRAIPPIKAAISRRIPLAQSGFTLIELMAAATISIFVVGSAFLGWYQMEQVREKSQTQSERIQDLQKTLHWITEDIAHMLIRPMVDGRGTAHEALEFGSGDGSLILQFTRGGWGHPGFEGMPPRSELQRVGYALSEGKLYRVHWYHLDRVNDDPPRLRLLMQGIEEITFRFLDSAREWHDLWPPGLTRATISTSREKHVTFLPLAVEMTLKVSGWKGSVRRLVLLAG